MVYGHRQSVADFHGDPCGYYWDSAKGASFDLLTPEKADARPGFGQG